LWIPYFPYKISESVLKLKSVDIINDVILSGLVGFGEKHH